MDTRKSRTAIDAEANQADKDFTQEEGVQDEHVKEVDGIEKTVRSTESAGTAEGHDNRAKLAKAIDRALKQHMEKLARDEEKISKEGKGEESKLADTSKRASSDKQKAQELANKVKLDSAKKEIKSVADSSADDEKFLDKVKTNREKRRERADKKTKKNEVDVKRRNISI